MKPSWQDKAAEILTQLDEMGAIDDSAYALPLDDPDGDLTLKHLLKQQEQERQAGRWQAMQARHWLNKAIKAESDDDAKSLFTQGKALYWEAMAKAGRDPKRLTKLRAKGGRPASEDIDTLVEGTSETLRTEGGTKISAMRRVIKSNDRLTLRYGSSGDDYLRKIVRVRQKKIRP